MTVTNSWLRIFDLSYYREKLPTTSFVLIYTDKDIMTANNSALMMPKTYNYGYQRLCQSGWRSRTRWAIGRASSERCWTGLRSGDLKFSWPKRAYVNSLYQSLNRSGRSKCVKVASRNLTQCFKKLPKMWPKKVFSETGKNFLALEGAKDQFQHNSKN